MDRTPNWIERTLTHALFIHPHHNTDRLINFGIFAELNNAINAQSPGAVIIGPNDNDDAGVGVIPGENIKIVSKVETHCSPSAVEPYGSAATCAGGTFRDVLAMGARVFQALDLIGGPPPDVEVLVGPCALKGDGKTCTCGHCKTMLNVDRNNLMIQGVRDMCQALDIPIMGGGITTSIQGAVPLIAVAAVGVLVTEQPLTKPAKNVGDIIVLIGETGDDGNDTAFRAGYTDGIMHPAKAVFKEERTTMDAMLAIFATDTVNACSDLGAAGIGAAVCESARYGGLGATVDLSLVPLKADSTDISNGQKIFNETQARFIVQVNPADVETVIAAAHSVGGIATAIGTITNGDETVFTDGDEIVAIIPNHPAQEFLDELSKK